MELTSEKKRSIRQLLRILADSSVLAELSSSYDRFDRVTATITELGATFYQLQSELGIAKETLQHNDTLQASINEEYRDTGEE
jgi:hypothetical protein